MKAFLFGRLALIITICFGFANALLADNIKVKSNAETKIEISENTYSNLKISNTISDITIVDIDTKEGKFAFFDISGHGHSAQVGEPMIPVMKKLIEVPLDATILVEVLSSESSEIDLSDFGSEYFLFPNQPSVSKSIEDPDEIEFIYNQATYQLNDYFKQDLVKVIDLGIMRGVRIARLEISPVQYNPVKNIIKVFDNLEVNISFGGTNISTAKEQKKNLFSPYFENTYSQLFNYKSLYSKGLVDDEPVTYVIVSDPDFEETLEPFVEWKIKKGFHVIEAYTDDPEVGSTTTSIQSYLQDLYENPDEGVQPQSFVLFVGDIAEIPAFSGTTGGHVSDLYYCEYTEDIYPECFYGRFSASTEAELQSQIDKTLEYEKYEMADPTFLDEVLMVAGNDETWEDTHGNGQINYGTDYYFNEDHGLYSHTFLQDPPNGNSAVHDSIIANINNGIAYGNYTAHCGSTSWSNPSFSTSDVVGLTNEGKYPLLVGNCCLSAKFDANDCLAEEVVMAEEKGAIGYIGGSNNTLWDEDYWWGVGYRTNIVANPEYDSDNLGAYDRLFHDNGESTDEWYITQGQIPSAGNLAVTQSGSDEETYYWEIYHLMGDPSLMIYMSQPPDAMAEYNELMPLSATSFEVTTDPYAYIAISKDGVLHGCAIADESGNADVTMFTLIDEPGEADIIITGQNIKPHISSILVSTPNGAYVLFDDFEIDDSAGNDNAFVDYSESISLNVTLKNLGNDTGSDISATISSDDEYITLTSAENYWPDILSDSLSTLEAAFDFDVNDFVPDQHMVPFTIDITDGNDSWSSNFSISLNAPVLIMGDYSIDDQDGNNNGLLDPGETVDIIINVYNNGHAEATSVVGEILCNDSFVTLNEYNLEFGDIDTEDFAQQTLNITVDENTPMGHYLTFYLEGEADFEYTLNGSFGETVGQTPVLIVDLDENSNSASVIETSMHENGVVPDFVTSIPTDLDQYTTLFICLGVYSDNYALSSSEGTILAEFLNDGGSLYLEGGDTWAFDSQTTVHTMFNIDGTDDGEGDLSTIIGATGTLTEEMSFTYSGDNNWIDVLEPLSPAYSIFDNETPEYTTAIAHEAEGYKTIGTSFEFGGLDDGEFPSTKVELMATYLDFFGVTSQDLMSFFKGEITNVCEGGEIAFIDQSQGEIVSWSWEFPGGNPETSEEQDPFVAYSGNGIYDVTLTVSDGTNTSSFTRTEYIDVMIKPEMPVVNQQENMLLSTATEGNQWYNSDGLIPGAVSQSYEPATTDSYYVIVTNDYGCVSEPSENYYFSYTGIIELSQGESVSIYPNPFSNSFTLDYAIESASQVDISIYNTYGQQIVVLENVSMKSVGNHRIKFNAQHLDAGIYYCKIETDDYSLIKKVIHTK